MSEHKDALLYATFVGELVELSTQFKTPEAQVMGSMTAYLLDIDDDYFYVGEGPQEATGVVRRDCVYSMLIVKPKSWKTELLEGLGDEPNESDLN